MAMCPPLVIVVVVDTSVSMALRTSSGLTVLDHAKAAVEHFVKQRERMRGMQGSLPVEGLVRDTYLLSTYATGAAGLPVVFQADTQSVLAAVKSLRAVDLSQPGQSLKSALEAVHLRRLKLELDTPGKGRKPWLVNPTLVLLLTRGGPSMSLEHGIRNALDLPVSRTPGSGLFSTPFRWDTKMFTIVLPGPDDVAAAAAAGGAGRRRGAGDRAGAGAGNGADAPKRPAQAHLSELSQATGGRLYRTTDVRGTRHVIDKIVTKIAQCGAMVDLACEPRGQRVPSCRARMVYLRGNPGRWPIPEAFFPSPDLGTLPPRRARPLLLVNNLNAAAVHDREAVTFAIRTLGFPADVYDIQRCGLTDALYQATCAAPPDRVPCWPVRVARSGGPGNSAAACGFIAMSHEPNIRQCLRQSSSYAGPATTCVLCLLPYDYPTLFRLLYQLGKAAGIERLYHNRVSMLRSVTREWSAAFAEYTSRLPTYYWTPLRQALMRCDLNNHVPNLGRDGLGYTRALRNNLKRLKQLGMAELASLQAACNSDIALGLTAAPGDRVVAEADGGALEPVDWADWRVVRRRLGTTSALGASASLPTAPRRVAPSAVASSGSTALGGDSDDDASSVSSGVTVASALSWRAAYDEEGPGGRHRVPIAQMGNFLTAFASKQVLRSPLTEDGLPEDADETSMFGSPYTTRRSRRRTRRSRGMPMVDEAAIAADEPGQAPKAGQSGAAQGAGGARGAGADKSAAAGLLAAGAAALGPGGAQDADAGAGGGEGTAGRGRKRKRSRAEDLADTNGRLWARMLKALRSGRHDRLLVCARAFALVRASRPELAALRRSMAAQCRDKLISAAIMRFPLERGVTLAMVAAAGVSSG